MLQKLYIQNYAIIDELEIGFPDGLNIITGETGAGKSILMGALSLILGERADSTVLQQKQKKCVAEGVFHIGKGKIAKNLQHVFEQNEWDWEPEMVIRREIAVNGKSRAFVNDTPATLVQLKQISCLLVDLHQQFDTLELGENDFQRQVLDAMADTQEQLQEYSAAYSAFKSSASELKQLIEKQSAANKELDYNQFLFDELSEAGFKENELENLDAELKLLSNAENIKQQLTAINFDLQESDRPLVNQLKITGNKLQALQNYHPQIAELSKRLLAIYTELKDIAGELDQIDNTINFDAGRIQEINDKTALGYKLLKKHGVQTTNELLQIQNDLEARLGAILNLAAEISKKEKEKAVLETTCIQLAESISARRKRAVKPFEEKVNELLKKVGMPNAALKIEIQPKPLSQDGMDAIEFLFDANLPAGQANKKSRFEPLSKVASGGELSRLMLCIKSLVAKSLQLPTLIFDEIDTGIGGEAARQVGNIMKSLAASHQIISITHQPQIAAKADTHFYVYKEINKDTIQTAVRQLNADERITAIAKMLSGEKPTAAAMENAREMVGN